MRFGREKVDLLQGQTPLEYLPAVSDALGIALYMKRDDLTPYGAGGNKLRKLEYLLADALQQGATRLLTVGSAQTNHGRLTAAVAAKYGLNCTIACIDDDPGEISANLLLDRILGAEVVLECGNDCDQSEEERFDDLTQRLVAQYALQGERVYTIPMGGSNVLGLLGYFDCAVELMQQAAQLGIEGANVICAVGSMGTYMGLFCGFQSLAMPLGLTGVAISPFGEKKEQRLMAYFQEAKDTYHLPTDASLEDFHIERSYTCGGYNNPSAEVRQAIYMMGRKEGIFLDPCYTGKAFAGLISMVKEGKIRQGEKVIFLHTGGMPGLYTRHHRIEMERELADGVKIFCPPNR